MGMQKTGIAIGPDRRGVAALEFALIAPVLSLLAFGIVQYGIYFGVSHAVQQLANDAARVAVGGLTDKERTTLVSDHVARHWREYGLHREKNVAVAVQNANGDIIVRARYDASYLPIFALNGLVPMPPPTIDNRASVRIGGF